MAVLDRQLGLCFRPLHFFQKLEAPALGTLNHLQFITVNKLSFGRVIVRNRIFLAGLGDHKHPVVLPHQPGRFSPSAAALNFGEELLGQI